MESTGSGELNRRGPADATNPRNEDRGRLELALAFLAEIADGELPLIAAELVGSEVRNVGQGLSSTLLGG